MTRRINLSQIGSYSTEKYEQLLRVVVFETDSRLKQGSPVDTGRFRMSWAISEQGTPGYDAGPQAGGGAVLPPRRLDYQVERAGGVYHIHNNLPYAEPLANGHSQQAPAGWTDLIAREMTQWARAEADKLGRAD
jgi:hypothetical protein